MEEFILNTSTGVLHTKNCADGLNGLSPVAPGRRKHYSDIDNAKNDSSFSRKHNHPQCLEH